jgi:predicted HTH domain antitoxin
MNLTLEIPDELAGRLSAAGADLSRRALEAFALEEYKSGRISKAELRRLLGFSTRYELDGFLKAHEVWIDYTVEDFRREMQDLKRLGF